ncbi:MAG: hypothetical protein HY831_00265 [Candidatus Aenigmarchaeota archaeon]|nr:hypothetical protein [Candidatus Aenigmarchaeota archaeon]
MKGGEETPSKQKKERKDNKSIKLPKFLRSFTEVPCHCKKCKADVSVSLSDCKCPGCGEKEHLKVKERPY